MVDSRSLPLLVIVSIFCGTTLIATLLRCYVRIRLVKAFGLDDYFTVASVASFFWYAACSLSSIKYGTGRYMSEISDDDAVQALRFWWLCYISYCITMTLVKIGIGLFFLRITVTRCQKALVWTTIGATILSSTIFFFVVIFQCSPVPYFWTKVYLNSYGSCIKPSILTSLGYAYGALCAVCDMTYGILPVLLVWKLEIRFITKVLLVPIIGMAAIASCAVFARMAYLRDLQNPEFLYATTDVAVWSFVEAGLAITASSLATLRPLFKASYGKNSYPVTRRISAAVNQLDSLPPQEPSPKRFMGTFERLQASNSGTKIDIWTGRPSAEHDVERADDGIIINGEAYNTSILVKTDIEMKCDKSGESSI